MDTRLVASGAKMMATARSWDRASTPDAGRMGPGIQQCPQTVFLASQQIPPQIILFNFVSQV